jgi:hypothetical protein
MECLMDDTAGRFDVNVLGGQRHSDLQHGVVERVGFVVL